MGFEKVYPFKGHYFDVDGTRMHYLDEGQGHPVVMLHGNPTWSFYYRNLIQKLKSSYRVIVPDHIGCGFSDKPTDERYRYTLERRVNDVESLIHHLQIDEPLTLVLHDWGGMIGMAYASRAPQRIARLVIMNTAAFHLPSTKPFPWALRLCRGPLGALLVRGLNLFSLSASRIGTKRRKLTEEERAGYLAPYDSWGHRIAVHRFVEDIPLSPRDPAFETVSHVESQLDGFRNTPMLIFWGEKDFVFDRHFLAEWKRQFPHAEVVSFPDCGHYILDDAFEEIAPRVEAFLGQPLATPQGAQE